MLKSLSPATQVIYFIFLALFMSILGELVYSLALSIVVPQELLLKTDWTDPRIYISRSFFAQVFMFLLSFMWFLRMSGDRFTDLVLVKKMTMLPLLITLAALVICLALFPVLEWLNEPLRQFLPDLMLADERETDALHVRLVFNDDTAQYFFLMISMAVLPAIFEEIVFRGFLIHKMIASGLSENGAIIMSAAIFAIIHFQPMKFLAMFVLGLSLGVIYRKFGNIKYSMLFHFLINGSQITVGYLMASGRITEAWF